LFVAVAAAGCKPEVAAPPPAPNAGQAVPLDNCSQWLKLVCSKVAEQDPLCESVQEAVGILTEQTCAIMLQHSPFTEAQLQLRSEQCGVLADRVCADLPTMNRFCKLARTRLATYTPNYCVDMLRKYPETIAQLTKQATASRLSPERAARLLQGEPPDFGPKDGAIQVVEFVDYESPYSAQTAAIVRNLAVKYATELHFVIRQFPLPDNPHAHLAAEAALAANAQGRYWPMHDKLLENREHLDRASLLRYAAEIGLNIGAFQSALASQRYAALVDADLKLGDELNVVGMPTVFVNGERVANSVDEQGIVEAIEEHRAAGVTKD
jgi:protein-disulfide isomerase